MTAPFHVHGYIRMKVHNPIVVWVAFRLGLGRFLMESGTEACSIDCINREE